MTSNGSESLTGEDVVLRGGGPIFSSVSVILSKHSTISPREPSEGPADDAKLSSSCGVSGPDSNCRCEGNETNGAGAVSVEGRVVASQPRDWVRSTCDVTPQSCSYFLNEMCASEM